MTKKLTASAVFLMSDLPPQLNVQYVIEHNAGLGITAKGLEAATDL